MKSTTNIELNKDSNNTNPNNDVTYKNNRLGETVISKPGFRDVKVKKDKSLSDDDVRKSLNIPERNEELYPTPDEKDVTIAGALITKMTQIGAHYDLNMGAIMGQLYIDLYNCLMADDKEWDNATNGLAQSLNAARLYISSSNNPLFKVPVLPSENTVMHLKNWDELKEEREEEFNKIKLNEDLNLTPEECSRLSCDTLEAILKDRKNTSNN